MGLRLKVGLKRNGKASKVTERYAGLTGGAKRKEDGDLNESEILCRVNSLSYVVVVSYAQSCLSQEDDEMPGAAGKGPGSSGPVMCRFHTRYKLHSSSLVSDIQISLMYATYMQSIC